MQSGQTVAYTKVRGAQQAIIGRTWRATGEGVWGLQRAFKLAGVQTIVMSLWAVDDEATAVLMQYFYEELMKEQRALAKAAALDPEIAERLFDYAHSALARAQHRMQQHPKYSEPYYWAGFVVVD